MLLKAKYVIPISAEIIEDGAVYVQGEQIVEVGSFADLVVKYPTDTIKDFGISAILPGFINVHSHIEYSALRGLITDTPYAAWRLKVDQYAAQLQPEDWIDSAYLGVLEAVRGGITTIADITHNGASLIAASEVGLRSIIYRETGTLEKDKIEAEFTSAQHDIEQWQGQVNSERTTVGIAPTALFACHPEMLTRIAAYAQANSELPVSMHLAGSQEEYDYVRFGSPAPFIPLELFGETDPSADLPLQSSEHLAGTDSGIPAWLATGTSPVRYVLNWGILDCPNVLAVHCVHTDAVDLEILAAHDVSVALCSRCNAQLGMGLAPLDEFLRVGLRVGIGTDSPAAVEESDIFSEMRLGILLQRATGENKRFLSAEKMLRMATLGGAQALRIDDKVGSLEAGKQADIIAVDLSNSNQVPTHNANSAVVNTASPDNVLMTMVAGEIIYDGHHRHAVDVAHVFARSEEMRLKLKEIDQF